MHTPTTQPKQIIANNSTLLTPSLAKTNSCKQKQQHHQQQLLSQFSIHNLLCKLLMKAKPKTSQPDVPLDRPSNHKNPAQ